MRQTLVRWFGIAIAVCLPNVALALGNLVTVEWLGKNLGRDDILLIDASSSRLYAANHIPGATSVDLYRYGSPHRTPPSEMERRFQSWGVSPEKHVVIYDEGGSMMATWLFYQLYYHGFPGEELSILDGGLAKWQAAGGAVAKDSSPPPAKGSFHVTALKEGVRVRLAAFVAASGDPADNALVEALEPSYHFGETKFFDRPGHVPNAVMLPAADFFNPDKTFKSPAEIRKMAAYLGIRPEQHILAHCGGGVAATVPFFAFKFISDYPQVQVYNESQMEWLQDERGLPFWTYDAPYLERDMNWLQSWGNRMMRMYGVAQLSVVDVRPAEAYRLGHVPYALNIPADTFRSHLDDPARLAGILGPTGMNPAHEAVIVSDGGLNPASALAFLMLEKIGQKKVSVLMDSVDEWGLHGYPLTRDPTVVGTAKTPQDMAVPAVPYEVALRPGVTTREAQSAAGPYPRIYIASGKSAPQKTRDGKVLHVPYTDLLNADGTPKPAQEVWKVLAKAGVPRYAEIVCFSDDPGEAAVNYFVLKLMGFPDVKVLLS